jgi:hypothetical protein
MLLEYRVLKTCMEYKMKMERNIERGKESIYK